MKPLFVYPGSFCPPTYGHLAILNKAADLFPRDDINVICSLNPEKKALWFTPEECAEMWKTYDLPENTEVKTLDDFVKTRADNSDIIMIRGIRDDKDLDHEKKIVLFNQEQFGIEKYLYILSDCQHRNISSTLARKAAEDLNLTVLANLVSPMIVTKILERALKIKNLFMVVGRPGSGKSTLLSLLSEKNPENIFIDTDEFTRQLRPLLEKTFDGADLINLATNHEEKIIEIIRAPWLELVKKALKSVPENCSVFLEVPYGLQENKKAFRFLGGKIIYIGCKDKEQNKQRVIRRGDPQIIRFIDKIPGEKETLQIAKTHKLRVICIDTSGTMKDLENTINSLQETIRKEV